MRRESAQQATAIAESQRADQERTLLFNLRNAFVQTLQQKAVLALTRDSLAHYDRLLAVSRDRFKAGDIAKVDLVRLELQRVQFETDVQTALVNLRTAKIQLLTLLNDRTPVEQFDIDGPFDFTERPLPLEEFRRFALGITPRPQGQRSKLSTRPKPNIYWRSQMVPPIPPSAWTSRAILPSRFISA